ncbi:MAG: PAS domain-containing sensor histidine kinase [Methanoregulaceae archaeon]|nr:PAS domain-containing sensor histidine kinase [Methanoregulaceae archaeon]
MEVRMFDTLRASKVLTILFLMLLIIVSIGGVYYVSGQTREALLETTRDELRTIAAIAAGQVDGDAFSRLSSGDEATPEFARVRDRLDAVKRSTPDIVNVYTMRRNSDVVTYVVVAGSEYQDGGTISAGTESPAPSTGMKDAFAGTASGQEYPTGSNSSVLSGFAPIYDSKGIIVGIAGVDMDASRIFDRLNFLGGVIYFLIVGAMFGIAAGAVGLEVIRARTEEVVAGSERTMRAIFNSVYDAIFLHDDSGKILDVNDQVSGLYGITREEAGRLSIVYDLSAPSGITGDLPGVWKDVMGGKPRFFEWKARKPHTGEEFDVEVYLRKIPMGDREVLMANVRDITERKYADEAIRQANIKLNLLNSITRHDIFNQLTIILGYLTLIEEEPDDPGNVENLATIQRAAETVRALIAFTRDYQDIGVKSPAWQDLHTVIRKAADILEKPGIRVTDEVTGIEVYADPLFEKVVYNLIQNAIEHGGSRLSSVSFSVMERGASITLICEDNGEGIAETGKGRIFRRSNPKKTGIGLFLSREILSITGITIEEHGTPGKGARFEMHIPRWRSTGPKEREG